ncbi:MAG TPA: biotin/lipoyl-containing protein [Membranihabitans sp.]|nr:biotin/lipoyl-containing protein [Membranihabitans sp.]
MKARVNDRFEYELKDLPDMHVVPLGANRYQIKHHGRNVEIELLKQDLHRKNWTIVIDGFVLEVDLVEELDMILDRIRQLTGPASGDMIVTAPIPGLIKGVKVADNQDVDAGEILIILEAMKMENYIQAPVPAKRIKLHVLEGERVVKGQKLCTLMQS